MRRMRETEAQLVKQVNSTGLMLPREVFEMPAWSGATR